MPPTIYAFRARYSNSGIWHVYDPQRGRGLCKVEIRDGVEHEFQEARLIPKPERCVFCAWARGWPSYNPDVVTPDIGHLQE